MIYLFVMGIIDLEEIYNKEVAPKSAYNNVRQIW